MFPRDLRSELRWLASGFLLMMYSGFGQTFYVAVFAGQFKGDLGLTDGEFGGLYTIGTLVSAVLLTWAGKLADTVSIRWLGAGTVVGLAMAAAAMSLANSALALMLALFGLRFFGQGMCTHTAMTAMGRWFNRKRGRAVSIAGLGLPAAEGLMPPLAVVSIAWLGWRSTWLVSALLLLLVAAPALALLLRNERHPTLGPGGELAVDHQNPGIHWTRRDVIGSGMFYALLPGVLAPAFIVTAIFFNQVTIVEDKGWTLSWFAAWFPLLAIIHVVASLAAGWLIDRYGARHLLPYFLIPLGAGTLCLALFDAPLIMPFAMTLVATTIGISSATSGALWAELYGTLYLGSIRSITSAAGVLASAIAPGLVGILLDYGADLSVLLAVLACYCLAASAWMRLLAPRLDLIAAASA